MNWLRKMSWFSPKEYSELTNYKEPLLKFLLSTLFIVLFIYTIPLKINLGIFTGFFKLIKAFVFCVACKIFLVSIYELFMVFYNKHHRFKPKVFSVEDILRFVYIIPEVELEVLNGDDTIRLGCTAEFNNKQSLFGNDPIYKNKMYYLEIPEAEHDYKTKVFPNNDYFNDAVFNMFSNEIIVKSVNGFNPKVIDCKLQEERKRKK